MNRIITLLLLLSICAASMAQSQDYLKILNPKKGNWTAKPGAFENINVTLRPAGLYCRVDMDFEITCKNTGLAANSDSLEAEIKFRMPRQSLLLEAYLWMFGQEVRAKLYEREKAKMIYESLVQRRVDPLIVYEGENKNFEARIFPVVCPNNRHARLTFLIPFQFGYKGIELPFSLSLFHTNITESLKAPISITIQSDAAYGEPEIPGHQPVSQNGFSFTYLLPGTSVSTQQLGSIRFLKGTQKEFYLRQPINANEGFYQYAILPTTSPKPGKFVFVMDQEWRNQSNLTPSGTAVTMLLNQLSNKLGPADQFNVIYNQNNSVVVVSNTWLQADSTNLSNAFTPAIQSTSINSSAYFSIQEAFKFLNANGNEGKVFLLSNAYITQGSPGFQNQMINSLLALSGNRYPVHVMDFNEVLNYNWVNGTYFYNNQYFFENISLNTGGTYNSLITTNGSYYNSSLTSTLSDMMRYSLRMMRPVYNFIYADQDITGTAFQRYALEPTGFIGEGDGYTETGRYTGTGNASITFMYGLKDSMFAYQTTLVPQIEQDTVTQAIWAGQYIKDLLNSGAGQISKPMLIQASLRYHVLCSKTAFLALEQDTASTSIPSSPTTLSVERVDQSDESGFSAEAYPNPFTDALRIRLNLPESLRGKSITIRIYDLVGRELMVRQHETALNELQDINLTLSDMPGLDTGRGFFIFSIEIEGIQKNIKVLKL